ncbi:MAG: cytochrome c3 family protein [Sideroxydans sp.]|nr:cytochrome c3 family protein [Sideroxydans sp.]
MISCLLIHISRNAQGIEVRKETVVSGATLSVGRGAECEIHLQDHQVYLHHATVKRSEDGKLYLESEKNADININGAIEQSMALSPGTRVEIGPYLLEVIPHSGEHDIALSVELMLSHLIEQEAAKKRRKGVALTVAALGISKRKISAALALLILFVFLLMPLLPHFFPKIDRWQSTSHTSLAASWSAGDLSGDHAVFGAQCSVCHQRAFREVGDAVCTGCHKNISGDTQNNAGHFNIPDKMRCTHCHQDHKGADGLAMRGSTRCVACHAKLKKWKADTQYADVSDFGSAHPEFNLAPAGAPRTGAKELAVEQNGLKFPHQLHMAKEGVATLRGDMVMVCQDCHHLEESGRHFAPVKMAQDCQQSGCHRIKFSAPLEGKVPHGSVSEVAQYVREYFFYKMSGQPPARFPECGQGKGSAAKKMLDCADQLTQQTLESTLLNKNKVCSDCHQITKTGDTVADWEVAPVKIRRDWFRSSVFSHAKHSAAECTTCHNKLSSKLSADVAMPGINICRECHTGDRKVKYKISSGCATCHKFHGGETHVWKKRAGNSVTQEIEPTK